MESLFEISTEKYREYPCQEKRNYDGECFPQIINEILQEFPNEVIFGGSSLIHDLYFPEEFWDRDYDLWCSLRTFREIKKKLDETPLCSLIKGERFEEKINYYGRINVLEILEYYLLIKTPPESTRQIKIQLIKVGNYILPIMNSIDLTFNSVFYDGKEIIFVSTTEEEVKKKEGSFLCCKRYCNHDDTVFTSKEITRIIKYQQRGFKIKNVCHLCDSKSHTTNIHCYACLKNKLGISTKRGHYYFEQCQLSEDQLSQMMSYENDNECVKNAIMLILLLSRNVELFRSYFEKLKPSINIRSPHFNDFLGKMALMGSLTGFQSMIELFLPFQTSYSTKRMEWIFKLVCRKNFHSLARYFTTLSRRYVVDIMEDRICNYKFLNIFEYYEISNDANEVVKSFKKITFLENPEEEICFICHFHPQNLSLNCGHKFCDICLMAYFGIEFRAGRKLLCPLCRKEINYNYN